MASVVEVKTAPVKVESLTVKLSPSDARDLQLYMKTYYRKNGYGENYEKNIGLWKVLQEGLEGKTSTPAAYVF